MKNLLVALAGLSVLWLVPDYARAEPWEDDFLKSLIKAVDSSSPTVRNFAVTLAKKSPGEFNLGQVFAIHDQVRESWKYVEDPRGDNYFATATESIKNGLAGDCDDFAVVMAALLESIGGRTRITIASQKKKCHAYTEVWVGKPKTAKNGLLSSFATSYPGKRPQWRTDSAGIWLNLDWQSPFPGGDYYKSTQFTIFYPSDKRYDSFPAKPPPPTPAKKAIVKPADERATELVVSAKAAIKSGNTSLARVRLESVLFEYGTTRAAKQARELLDGLPKE